MNEHGRASFVHGFINCNMKVKYRLSIDYDQKKEIFLKTYNCGSLINKGYMPSVTQCLGKNLKQIFKSNRYIYKKLEYGP